VPDGEYDEESVGELVVVRQSVGDVVAVRQSVGDELVENDTVDVVENVFDVDRHCELVTVVEPEYVDDTVTDCVMVDVTAIDHDKSADADGHEAVCEFDFETVPDGEYDGESDADTDDVGVFDVHDEADGDTEKLNDGDDDTDPV
jgi:hypothetical protein